MMRKDIIHCCDIIDTISYAFALVKGLRVTK